MQGLPATEESTGGSYLPPGLHRVKISAIKVWVDFNKVAKKDNNGNPGVEITFIDANKRTIKEGFYYSTLPIDHAGRKDDNVRCKSEFLLTNLKTALGFGTGAVTENQLKSAKVWAVIGNDEHFWKGEATGKNYSFMAKKFFPDNKVKPAILGDPDLPQSNGIASGDFYKRTDDKKQPQNMPAAAPEPKMERRVETAQAETVEHVADQEVSEDDF
jgi:hypothetical protein